MGEKHDILVNVDHVGITLGKKPILHDFSATIRDIEGHGQVVALLGPSGTGKTVFFNICAGLLQPDTGSVRITAQQLPVHPGMVGVVFQSYPLFDHRTVLGNLLVAARRKEHDLLPAKDRALTIAERFGLSEHLGKYPAQLSGGQRQRVAIARQLLCSEHYLLMDEPFSGLDPLMKEQTCALIQEVAEQDELNTFIITTHDTDSALCVADTVWLFGRDRDGQGRSLGARIQRELDLAGNGLAWHPDLMHTALFADCKKDITAQYRTL